MFCIQYVGPSTHIATNFASGNKPPALLLPRRSYVIQECGRMVLAATEQARTRMDWL